MEAQLIDSAFVPCPPERSQSGDLAARVDRYLQAAGLADEHARSRLTATIVHDLTARTHDSDPAWAEAIAAIDRRLSAELAGEASGMETASPRGRVALGLETAGAPAGPGDSWATPERRRCAMPPQDLSLWRPRIVRRLHRLLRQDISHATQGLTACLCCLAVILIP